MSGDCEHREVERLLTKSGVAAGIWVCRACREEIARGTHDIGVPSRVSRRATDAAPPPHLPDSAAARKDTPIASGVIDYFPDALVAIAQLSFIGNSQHNTGQPLHWARGKSTDESDALMRHFVDRGTFDSDGVRHSTKVAWRALAMLQKEIEDSRKEGE